MILFIFSLDNIYSQNQQKWLTFNKADNITGFVESADHYLFATNGGLVKISKSGRETEFINKANSPLPSNRITVLKKDASGKLWIGTADAGLVSLHDNEWKFYSTPWPHYPRQGVTDIAFDNDDSVFAITTLKHLCKIRDDSLVLITEVGPATRKIAAANDGSIWITGNEIKRYLNDSLIFYKHPYKLEYNNVLFDDKTNFLWFQGGMVISRFDGNDWYHWGMHSDSTIGIQGFKGIKLAPNGHIEVLRGSMLLFYNGSSWDSTDIASPSIPAADFHFHAHEGNGNTWMASNEILYSRSASKVDEFTYSNWPVSFRPYAEVLVAPSPDGSMYIYSNGLYRYNDSKWVSIPVHPGLTSTVPTDFKIGKQGTLVLSTVSKGLFLHDGQSWQQYNSSNSCLPSDNIASVAVADDGILWLIISGKGIVKMEDITICYLYEDEFTGNENIRMVNEEAWFSSDETICRVSDKIEHIDPYEGGGLYNNSFSHIEFIHDIDGSIWAINSGKPLVHYFDGIPVIHNTGNPNFDKGRKLIIDHERNIWVGGGNQGFGLMKYSSGIFTIFDEREVPFTGRVRSMVKDTPGNLWILSGADNDYSLSVLLHDKTSSSHSGEPVLKAALKIFPNPAKDEVQIIPPSKNFKGDLILMDVSGRVLMQKAVSTEITLGRGSSAPGIYIVELRESTGERYHGRLVWE